MRKKDNFHSAKFLKPLNCKTKPWLHRIAASALLLSPIRSDVISNIQLTNIFNSLKRVFIKTGKSRVTLKRPREQGEQVLLCLMALDSRSRTRTADSRRDTTRCQLNECKNQWPEVIADREAQERHLTVTEMRVSPVSFGKNAFNIHRSLHYV